MTTIVNPHANQEKHQLSPDDEFFARLYQAEHENHDEYLQMLRTATPNQARAVVQHLDLRALYELPRDVVENWEGSPLTPGTARASRTERLIGWHWSNSGNTLTLDEITRNMWRLDDIAQAANVRYPSVSRWRYNGRRKDPDWTKCLPEENDSVGGTPLWNPGTVLEWLHRTERITDDLYPHARERGGRIPPGRPPKQRTAE